MGHRSKYFDTTTRRLCSDSIFNTEWTLKTTLNILLDVYFPNIFECFWTIENKMNHSFPNARQSRGRGDVKRLRPASRRVVSSCSSSLLFPGHVFTPDLLQDGTSHPWFLSRSHVELRVNLWNHSGCGHIVAKEWKEKEPAISLDGGNSFLFEFRREHL